MDDLFSVVGSHGVNEYFAVFTAERIVLADAGCAATVVVQGAVEEHVIRASIHVRQVVAEQYEQFAIIHFYLLPFATCKVIF